MLTPASGTQDGALPIGVVFTASRTKLKLGSREAQKTGVDCQDVSISHSNTELWPVSDSSFNPDSSVRFLCSPL